MFLYSTLFIPSSSNTVSIRVFLVLYTGLILHLTFSKSDGVHDRLHIYPPVGDFFTPPGIDMG